MPLDRALRLPIKRILALGYSEASRRKTQAAKLDALIETTVAVCDLLAPEVHEHDFFLSDVSITQPGRTIGSSLAAFDDDIREYLITRYGVRTRHDLGDNVVLSLPSHAMAAQRLILTLWQQAEALDLHLADFTIAEPSRPAVRDDVVAEFYQSLRHAFDSMLDWDHEGDVHTLKVDRFRRDDSPASFPLNDTAGVTYTLGYCLPTSTLRRIARDVDRFRQPGEIEQLEVLYRPAQHPVRTWSHTFVSSRSAGFGFNVDARDSHGSLCRLDYTDNREREKLVWSSSALPHVYMMPLASYGTANNPAPVTVAHSFTPLNWTPRERPIEFERLLTRRYRARTSFHDTLYQCYCSAVARTIAEAIARGLPKVNELNQTLAEIALAYAQQSQWVIGKAINGADSLKARLGLLLIADVGVSERVTKRHWASIEPTLSQWNFDRPFQARQTEETDVLVRLIGAIDTELKRVDANTRTLSYLEELGRHIQEAESARHELITFLTPWDTVWLRLEDLRNVFEGSSAFHDGQRKVRLGGVDFVVGHSSCGNCDACRLEQQKQVAYVFGTHLQAATRFENFVNSISSSDPETNPSKILKYACGDDQVPNRLSPTVAALVVMLIEAGGAIESVPRLNDEVARVPDGWMQSIKGLGGLASEGHGMAAAAVAVHVDQSSVSLILSRPSGHDWFVDARKAATEERKGPTAFAKSMRLNIANVYVQTLPIPSEESIGDVTLALDGSRIRCTWRRKTPS